MSKQQSDTAYKAAQLVEFLRENEDFKKAPADWWAPLVEDKKTLSILNHMQESLNRPVEETKLGKEAIRKSANKAVWKAVNEESLSGMSAHRGFPYSSNVGGTRRLLDLVDRLEDGYISYIYGDMGTGKTDFAIFLAELWKRQNSGLVGSNIETLEQKDDFIERFDDLQDWIQGPGEKLFIFDEASSHASGYGSDAGKVTKHFRQLLRTFRKNGANLLIIGHTGKDVHPDVRRLATDIIHKESKSEATIYNYIEDGTPEDQKGGLEGIEPTAWNFDTKEESRWFWES
jgi:hypothetical protein